MSGRYGRMRAGSGGLGGRSDFRKGELALARDADKLVGTVRTRLLPSGAGELGVLTAHPAYRGTGVGRELVAFAERWAREQGRTKMQLELLMPQGSTRRPRTQAHRVGR